MAVNTSRSQEENEIILRKYANTVYRIAYLRTGTTYDAEDIMQEVFLRFVKHSPDFQSLEHEKAWFIRATINRTNSFFTSAYKRRVIVSDETVKDYDSMNDSEVLDAVMQLPKDISTAIHLYYYEGTPVKEIAECMKKSEAAVKSLLFRGRKLLRLSLEDTYR